MTNIHGMKITENSGVSGLTPYDRFLWMFTMSRLKEIVVIYECAAVISWIEYEEWF